MATARVRPITEQEFPAIAAFLAAEKVDPERRDPSAVPAADAALAQLRWQTLAKPAPQLNAGFGFYIEDEEGRVAGTHLAFPQVFLIEDERVLGLAGSALRAHEEVRVQSSAMFYAFLKMKGVDFHYSTTANRFSAAYWAQMRAGVVEGTDHELVFPLRAGSLLDELRLQGRLPLPAAIVAPLAAAATAVVQLGRTVVGRPSSQGIRVEPSEDLDKLSILAERNRDPRLLSTERTPAYLRWRYLQGVEPERNELLVLRDQRGNEAWAATRQMPAGFRRQIRAVQIMDLAWPPDRMDPAKALAALVGRYRGRADIVRLKGRRSTEAAALSVGFHARAFESPSCYIIETGTSGRSLAERADFVSGDND